jgi:hypothetical protein
VTLIVASSRRKLLIQLCSASVGQCGPQHYWFGYCTHMTLFVRFTFLAGSHTCQVV